MGVKRRILVAAKVYPQRKKSFVEGWLIVFLFRRALITTSFVVVLSPLLFAQFPMPTQRQQEDLQPARIRELVSKYCRLDYEGMRLDPQAWGKFQPLVWWTAAPAYNKIDVVARYTADDAAEDHGKYSVTVHYRLLGTFDPSFGYVREPEGATQDVFYSVTSENTEWRIADADNTLPHPSRAAMLKWLTQQIAAAQDPAVKTRYQISLETLQAQSGSPFAR